jgi:hypothetical protein
MPETDGTYSDCIDDLNPVNGHPDCSDASPDFPSEYERAVSEDDEIKFYCCEAGTTQTVILRVYQTDIFGNITVDQDDLPIYNECMIQVEVQDKIKPTCQARISTQASGPTVIRLLQITAVWTKRLQRAPIHKGCRVLLPALRQYPAFVALPKRFITTTS